MFSPAKILLMHMQLQVWPINYYNYINKNAPFF